MSTIKKAVIGVGALVVVAAGAVGADLAFNNGSTPVQLTTATTQTTAGSQAGVANPTSGSQVREPHRRSYSPLVGVVARAIYADVVVAGPQGQTTTYLLAKGPITALSSSSITVSPPGEPPVTAALTSSTTTPGKATDFVVGEDALLVAAKGNALLVRALPAHPRATTTTAG